MKILVTNDDGILADGLWKLVSELKKIARVIVVAPDREQSGVGTAVTLRQPLKVQKVTSIIPEIEAYSVTGTPADSVILALGKLAGGRIDLVVSGINSGPNLGEDVFISGTVGAALQGYFHGLPALAISVDSWDNPHLESAAKLAALLAKKIATNAWPTDILLNVNLPNLPIEKIKGIRITRLTDHSHHNTVVVKEADDGRHRHYWLVRQRLSNDTDPNADVAAIEQGCISITPLQVTLLGRTSTDITDNLCTGLLEELRGS